MPQSQLIPPELAADVLKTALHRGGEFADLYAEERWSTGAVLEAGTVGKLSSGQRRGAGVRVISGGATGFAYTADLSERGLHALARAASAIADRPGSAVTGPVPVTVPVLGAPPRQEWPEPAQSSRKVKIERLRYADDVARGVSPAIAGVHVSYGDSSRRLTVANSAGTYAEDFQVRNRFNVTCIVRGDTGLQTGYERFVRTVGSEIFDQIDVADMARGAARHALTKLNAAPAPSGEYVVVLAAGSGGILFHEACGHGLEADNVQRGQSVYASKLDTPVAGPGVTFVDDGTVPQACGSSRIDDDGAATRRTTLIEDGRLVGFMRKLEPLGDGAVPTGNPRWQRSTGNCRRQSYQHLPLVRMTNTFILPGPEDRAELIGQTRRGIYIAKLGGGQVNVATGEFVFGTTEAYLIENGQVTRPLLDTNLLGSGPEALSGIDAIAGDLDMAWGACDKDGQRVSVGCGQPSLRIRGLTVGGHAG